MNECIYRYHLKDMLESVPHDIDTPCNTTFLNIRMLEFELMWMVGEILHDQSKKEYIWIDIEKGWEGLKRVSNLAGIARYDLYYARHRLKGEELTATIISAYFQLMEEIEEHNIMDVYSKFDYPFTFNI